MSLPKREDLKKTIKRLAVFESAQNANIIKSNNLE